jgi:uncharacterized membrane protein
MKLLKIIVIVVLLLVLVVYNYYSLVYNKTNHTGFNTKYIFLFFISCGVGLVILSRIMPTLIPRHDVYVSTIMLLLMLIGINIYLFDYLNIMVHYDTWLMRGMPSKPF